MAMECAMFKTFTCYLHKPDTFTPELRVVACETEEMLPDAIQAEMPSWGAFDAIEVYDDVDRPIFRFTRDGLVTQ